MRLTLAPLAFLPFLQTPLRQEPLAFRLASVQVQVPLISLVSWLSLALATAILALLVLLASWLSQARASEVLEMPVL
jgi:hypothetical protein